MIFEWSIIFGIFNLENNYFLMFSSPTANLQQDMFSRCLSKSVPLFEFPYLGLDKLNMNYSSISFNFGTISLGNRESFPRQMVSTIIQKLQVSLLHHRRRQCRDSSWQPWWISYNAIRKWKMLVRHFGNQYNPVNYFIAVFALVIHPSSHRT